MDRLFIHTNILLDVLESRPAFVADSLGVIALAKKPGQAKLAVSPLSLSDITYILRKSHHARVIGFFRQLRKTIEIAGLNADVVDAALASGMADFEDALQWQAARAWKATHFITRNPSDFPGGTRITVATPTEYLGR